MSDTAHSEWDLCKQTLRTRIPEPFYNTFIEPLRALQTDESVLSLVVPEARLKEHIEMRYGSLLREAVQQHFPAQISLVRLQNADELPARPLPDSVRRSVLEKATSKVNHDRPIQWDGRFLPHPALAEELASLLKLKKFYRPVYISGGAGSGKSVFARKWVEYFEGRATYISLPEFLESFVSSIRSQKTLEWKSELRSNRLLIVDDLQLLKTTAARCQEELRNLIDDFEREEKLIVFLADRDPSALAISRDLKSRLMPARHIHLIFPDKETRKQIVRSVLEEDGFTLKDEVIDHLATKIPTDMRLLRAAVHRLSFQSTDPRTMAADEVDRICEPLYRHEPGVRPEIILSIVAEFFHVSSDDIRSSAKDKKVSLARHTVSFLCSTMLNMTLSEIARITNRKDHTGVLYAINRLEKLLREDLFLTRQLEEIKDRILSESRR